MPLPAQTTESRSSLAERAFAAETDADLMVFMSMSDEDPTAARHAWAEFYGRHVDYLYAVCQRAYGDMLRGDTGVGDLVTETFQRAFRHAHLFRPEETDEPQRLRRRSRAWLGRIAQRLFQDVLRDRRRLETVQLEPSVWEQIPACTPVPSADRALVERVGEALAQLTEKEQIVIRTTFQWYRPGQTHQRLPSPVVHELAETLCTTPENLRQIRRRALLRIRTFLGQPSQLDTGGQSPAEHGT